jgi:hypothetical protein
MPTDLYDWLNSNDPVRKAQNTNILGGQNSGSYLGAGNPLGSSGAQNAYLPAGQPGPPKPPRINSQGVPTFYNVPDMWKQGSVPTLAQDNTIAKTKYNPVHQPVTALGDTGYTAAKNFNAGGALSVSTAASTSKAQSGTPEAYSAEIQTPGGVNSDLYISPTGQYKTASQMPNGGGALMAPAEHSGKNPARLGNKKKNPVYADSEFLSDTRNIDKALADYKAKLAIQKTRAGTDYSVANRDLTQQKTRDLSDIANDFAARGVINSGVYGQKLGDYNQTFGNQTSSLSRKYNQAVQDINTQINDYVRNAQQQKDSAKFAAIRRRAQKLGKI